MKFIEIKEIHDRLLGTTHIEADLALLRARNPQHKLLSATRFNLIVFASDLLMALLNEATEEQVVQNRREFVAAGAAEAPVENEAAENAADVAGAAEASVENEAAENAADVAGVAEAPVENEAAENAADVAGAAEKKVAKAKKKGSQKNKSTRK